MNKILKNILCLGLSVVTSSFSLSFAAEETKSSYSSTNNSGELKLASKDDIDDMISTYKKCFVDYIGDKYFKESFELDDVKVYKYVANGKAVSYAIVEDGKIENEDIYNLCWFYTKPDCQGKGYGTVFLKELTDKLSDKIMMIYSSDRGLNFYPKRKFLIKDPKNFRIFWHVPSTHRLYEMALKLKQTSVIK